MAKDSRHCVGDPFLPSLGLPRSNSLDLSPYAPEIVAHGGCYWGLPLGGVQNLSVVTMNSLPTHATQYSYSKSMILLQESVSGAVHP